ncbi:3-isopropylmalate dehydratase small subunit [Phenylobacterium sp.]|uniref:3-isopropylmalate dehydratase small subunit n=1 Tax=Phenylobacterium sp. TaxID=1871053 RepID=UPI00374D24F3
MESFHTLTAIAAPLPGANIDTDIIFPARFLLITAKRGLRRYAFYEWRYAADGAPIAEFVLNRPAYQGAEILVAGDNFGCGSSREQACWTLRDAGIRAVISTSFGEIFRANCCKNGIVPVTVSPEVLQALLDDAARGEVLTVDLESQVVVRSNSERIGFLLEGWRREALLNGWDEVDLILNSSTAAIAAHEARARRASPWLFEGD